MRDFNAKKKKKSGRAAVLLLTALEYFGQTAFSLFELAVALTEAGYGSSGSRIDYIIERNRARRLSESHGEPAARHKQFLYRLRRDGLIRPIKSKEGISRFCFTRKGLRMKNGLQRQLTDKLVIRDYSKIEIQDYIIVSFDVPERERRKRDWLRSALKNLGFSKIHQSVWIARVRLPKEFIEDLKTYNLTEKVEIFPVSKLGTLSAKSK